MKGAFYFWLCVVLTASVLQSSPVSAQFLEIEPNQTCAQVHGSLASYEDVPIDISGELSPLPVGESVGDVDFYYFEVPSGVRLTALLRMDSEPSGVSIELHLGLFDLECNRIPVDTNYAPYADGVFLRMYLTPLGEDPVPFYLGVTGFNDALFEGAHRHVGPYTLRLIETPDAAGPITGRVVDALTGEAVTGFSAHLFYCLDSDCGWECNWDYFEADRFFFGMCFGGQLESGTYLVRIRAQDHEAGEFGPFEVLQGEVADLGDAALQPAPVVFDNVIPCKDLQAEDTYCIYSIDIRNNTDQVIEGIYWSLVTSHPGVWSQWSATTIFQPQRSRRALIESFSSVVMQSRFRLPPELPLGTAITVVGYLSDRSFGHFSILRSQTLFTLVKTESGFLSFEGGYPPPL